MTASLLPAVRALLADVKQPAQYTGCEWNIVRKDPATVRGRIALCYPDCYEVGTSHNGLAVLYEMEYFADRGPVKFTLFRDGSYVRESATNGQMKDRQQFTGFYAKRDRRSGELKRAARKAPVTQVAGVGLAKVLSLGKAP